MFRYIALLWNSNVPMQATAAQHLTARLQCDLPGWTQVLSLNGMSVFVAGARRGASRIHVLGGAGVVLGTLFSRLDTEEGRFDLTLSCAQAAAVASTQGRTLITSYWGRYVAFLYEAKTDQKRVLRDPTGGMPCLCIDSGGVQICCSWLEDCLRLEPRRLSINWDTIKTCLGVSLFHSECSGLNEVSELRAGECLCLHNDSRSRSFYWNPLEVAGRNRILDSSIAATEIRRTTQMCVQAWASRYGGLIHYLSGGLDSAIVLAALGTAKRRTPVVTLNYFSPGTDGDERTYARAAARSVSYELIEQQRSTELDLREMLTAYRTAQPASYFVRLEAGKHEAALANRTGADGLFSGDGGDALFFRSPVVWTAIDYACDHGLVLSSLEIALNAACLDDRSVWPVLLDMWRYGVKRKHLHSLTEQRLDWGAVSAEVADWVTRRGDFTHPWFECSAAVAPGKLRQIFLLAFAPDFYDPFARGELPERVCPLLSQPLIELCLRIPTYVLAPGPQDRMLARNAFAADLPEEILYRRAKGGLVRHVEQILEANRAFLAELLLEGVLVSRGLLDRKKVADALSTTPGREKCSAPEIFDYAGIESWARTWPSSC